MTVGQYSAAFYVTETASGERTTAKTGTVTVTPNLSVALEASKAAQMLEAIDDAIVTLSAGTNQTVSFNNQSFTKKNLSELVKFRDRIRAEVLAEERLASGKSNNIQIRFGIR